MKGDVRVQGAVKRVISYAEDVHVWVYLDQVDRVIRFEAYVVGYNQRGEPSTLDFVLEEGVLDNAHEVPLFAELLHQAARFQAERPLHLRFSADGSLITAPLSTTFYPALNPEQMQQVHDYFDACEGRLKAERKARWTRMLHALGYDVIPSLSF